MKWRLSIFETLASTSTLLVQMADAGEPEGLAILARRQTAGRGTQGRDWQSPSGNLYLSVLLRPPGLMRQAPQWALLAAVALHEAAGGRVSEPAGDHVPEPAGGRAPQMAGGYTAQSMAAGQGARLKWPNDLMLNGGKAGGILAEAAADAQGHIAWLVLGFGVNLAQAPQVPGRITAALGAEPPEAFAQRLLEALARWHTTRLTHGFAPIREAWMRAGPDFGADLSVLRGATRLAGRYEGLSEDGGLLLAAGGRVHALHAGEVG